jgi:N-acetyl-gamma-glutamyl-phosphate reductase
MKKTRVAVQGATGYSALELLKILVRHPHVEIAAVTSRQEGSPSLASVHPTLNGRIDLKLEDLSAAEVARRAECWPAEPR